MDQVFWDHVRAEEKWLRDRLAEIGRVKKALAKTTAGSGLLDGGSDNVSPSTDAQPEPGPDAHHA